MPANNVQGLRADVDVKKLFSRELRNSGSDRARCKACNYDRSWNTTELRKHISICPGDQPTPTIKPTPQSKLSFKAVNIKQLDTLFAKAMYTSVCSFSFFETPEWRALFQALEYQTPSQYRLQHELLDSCYLNMKEEVVTIFNASPYLGLITDESTNINNERIENMSVSCKGTTYHWRSVSLGEKSANADATVNAVKQCAMEVTDGDTSRISSLATDTCAVQLSAWKKLHQTPGFSHIFMIGCESHSLQLVIKDLMTPDNKIQTFWKQFQSIISYFSNASKQLGLLRQKQEELVGKRMALISAGLTRWGTQVFTLFYT